MRAWRRASCGSRPERMPCSVSSATCDSSSAEKSESLREAGNNPRKRSARALRYGMAKLLFSPQGLHGVNGRGTHGRQKRCTQHHCGERKWNKDKRERIEALDVVKACAEKRRGHGSEWQADGASGSSKYKAFAQDHGQNGAAICAQGHADADLLAAL